MAEFLHAMLGKGLGGLEQVFLDYQPILSAYAERTGGACRALVRRGGAIETRIDAVAIPAFSDWDPLTRAMARRALGPSAIDVAVCHGQRAYRILQRVTPVTTRLVACIHKPKFDVDLLRTHYICVGAHLAADVASRGVPDSRIHFVPNAVKEPSKAATPFASSGQPPHIVAAGRLHAKKGFDLLLAALAMLAARNIGFRATIAGDGDQRQRLRAEASKLGLAGRVSFPGWCDDVPALLATGDVFVFPSRQEGFPLTLLEAMASGLPVVATRIPGTDEIIADDSMGLLVPVDDAQALADALAATLSQPAHGLARAETGRKRILQSFGLSALEQRLAAVIDSVLATASGDGR